MAKEAGAEAMEDSILSQQMDAIHGSSPASLLSILAAFLALYVYWSPEIAFGLIAWAACIVAIALTNLATTRMRIRRQPADWTNASWARFVTLMHLLSGLAWGVGGGWMLSIANEQQALLTLCIGLSAVTVSIPSVVYQPAYNLFQLPIFWCYAVGLMFSSLEFGWVVAVGFALVGPFAILIGRGLGDRLVMAMRLSIENKKLVERLEERGAALEAANRDLEVQSQTDPLTGTANRRRLMSFGRAVRENCAVVIVDVDHFKAYNDSFGHVEGDSCLMYVAQSLQQSVRPAYDLVARLGGEEFAVVLTEISEDQALRTAEAVRESVEALFATRPGKLRRPVTVSLGLAFRGPDRYKSFAQLIEEADAAVYLAKEAGRNRVCRCAAPRQAA